MLEVDFFFFFFFFLTLVTGPRRSLSLKLSDTRSLKYEPASEPLHISVELNLVLEVDDFRHAEAEGGFR